MREVSAKLEPGVRQAEQAAQGVLFIRDLHQGILAPANFEDAVSKLDLFRRAAIIQHEAAKKYAARSQVAAAHAREKMRQAISSAGRAAQARVSASVSSQVARALNQRLSSTLTSTQKRLQGTSGATEQFVASLNKTQQVLHNNAVVARETAKAYQSHSRSLELDADHAAAASTAASAAAQRLAHLAKVTKELSEFLFAVRHLNLDFDVAHKNAVKFGREIIKLSGGM